MLPEQEGMNIHERCEELSALANTGTLTEGEWAELTDHLALCKSCRDIHSEYSLLDRVGAPMLADAFAQRGPQHVSDDTAARQSLFERIRSSQKEIPRPSTGKLKLPAFASLPVKSLAWGALAADLMFAFALGGYRLGHGFAKDEVRRVASRLASEDQLRVERLTVEKKVASDRLDSEAKKRSQLESELSQKQAEWTKSQEDVAKVRSDLEAQTQLVSRLTASENATQEQLRAANQQRDALATRLQAAEHAYEQVRAELGNLRAERDRATLRMASLESENNALVAATRDQERRLKNSEQYLSSDRDIRELMGARQLYIADVYDIDSSSRTRKPFGRVFYTQGKSLIFYAFDLDRDPRLKSASAFQVWGRRNSDVGTPFNLGILYQDSAANRRWLLRIDDPAQLADINAVFVTVEPNGGSTKPTSKPFLYALLKKEPNHP